MKQSMQEIAYEIAQDLYQIGVMDAVTLREFNPWEVPPEKCLFSGEE